MATVLPTSDAPIEPKTGKRDHLIALEKKYQAFWAAEKVFEVNAPPAADVPGLSPAQIREQHPKWFGTFPFPYMNGSLHLGHAFTISKTEFAAGYQRMLGKRVLFPHGFHVTGLPIKASADKLIREMEMFGPDFENFEEVQQKLNEEAEEKEKVVVVKDGPVDKSKGKKGKLQAKSTGHVYQFQILQSIDIPTADIKLFADPMHWLTYFPPSQSCEDHTAFGSRIDWRRKFLTTPANPYYDAFVRWQMNKLHKLGKIKFGERYTIYSPKDGQPCMDHDRSDGEALGPQEYTAVKMEVVEWGADAKNAIEGKVGGRKVFLVAATLRPETMYGQTNCFVGTAIKYGVFAMSDTEAFVCTYRAARNMAFQGISKTRGDINQLLEIDGATLVGTASRRRVVTSVPSDSPDDCATLADLVKKPAFYGIEAAWVSIAPVPSMKIQSQKDVKQLAEAKEIAYKEGFYNGVMLGAAMAYAEPEGLVISRSTDECVVALMDQWYLDYGESQWRAETERLLPWDPQFLVESLSDSTIYMSYYTVAQLLHENSIDGTKPGPLGITPDQMTDEIWEYIFCNGPFPSPSPLPQEKADVLKHEFNYFYPVDLRSSAKDLVPNHLTFCLYNHHAHNGHLLLNGKKMSKSTGNSLSLREAISKFGADSTRLTLADAGDGVEDANFDEKSANANILRVHTLVLWCEEMVKDEANLRHGPKNLYHDLIFEQEVNDLINITQSHYEAMNYKDALKYGFYELQTSRDWYREVTADAGMHADLIMYWIRVAALLITPIAPHFAEHIHSTVLKSPTSVQLALWPTPAAPVDLAVIEAGAYMRGTIKTIRDAEVSLVKMLNKTKAKGGKKDGDKPRYDPKEPKSVRIYVATTFPEWQDTCVQVVKESYDATADKVDDAKVRTLLTERGLIKDKRAMPFVQDFKKRMAQFGAQTAFRRTLPFSERDVLSEIIPYLKKSLTLADVEVYSVDEALAKQGDGFTKSIIDTSEPGNPAYEYRNV
ncbi:leucine-tRNA ligase [Mycena rosella]|uniref:leucine--tRNA ligase n=1 Tax=Mycena rosella TaxID=1033263 RepID=A0AAD7G6A8_MYCRO|nr:leucine-tRNA ligase [Mycena rosella]